MRSLNLNRWSAHSSRWQATEVRVSSMSFARKECSQCGRDALAETIERNDGICGLCAKGKQAIKDGKAPAIKSERIVLWLTFVTTCIASALVVMRCLDADWGWFWSLFSIVWFAPIVFNFTSFLIGCVLWCHRRLTAGRPKRGVQGGGGQVSTRAEST